MANRFPWQTRPGTQSRRRFSHSSQSIFEWLQDRHDDEDFRRRMGWRSPSEVAKLKKAPPAPTSQQVWASEYPGEDPRYRFRADPDTGMLTGDLMGGRPADQPPDYSTMGGFAEQVQAAPEAPLSVSQEEQDFQAWFSGIASMYGYAPDPDDPLHFYDYRAAFRAGVREPEIGQDGLPHWPSAFKSDDNPNRVVGGFDTKTRQRDESVPMARSVEELISLGWDEGPAAQLGREHGLPHFTLRTEGWAGPSTWGAQPPAVPDDPIEEQRSRLSRSIQKGMDRLQRDESQTPDIIDPSGPRWAYDEDDFTVDLHVPSEESEGVFGRELLEHVPWLGGEDPGRVQPDRVYNIPTIWNGKQIEDPLQRRQIAARRLATGQQPMYPNYATAEEANVAAERRSRRIGELRATVQEGLAPPGFLQSTGAGFRRAATNVIPGPIRTGAEIISKADVGDWIDWDEDLREWSTKTIDEQNEALANISPRMTFTDLVDGKGNFVPKLFKFMTTTFPEQLAGMSPMIVAGYIGAGAVTATAATLSAPVWATAGLGALAGAGIMGLLYHSSDVQEQMKEQDPNIVAPWTALAAAVPMALLDSYVPGKAAGLLARAVGRPLGGSAATHAVARRINNRFFQKMDEAVKAAGGVQRGSWLSIAAETGKGLMVEAVTEVAQEAISTATADRATGNKTDWGEWSIKRPFDFGETGFLSKVPDIAGTAAIVGGAMTGTSEYVSNRLIGPPNESPLSLPSSVSLREFVRNQRQGLSSRNSLHTRINLKDHSDPGVNTPYNFTDSPDLGATTPEELVAWSNSLKPFVERFSKEDVSEETRRSPLNATLRTLGLVPLDGEKDVQKAERILATGRIVPQLYDVNGAMSEESILNSDMDIVTMAREIKRSETSAQKPFNSKANAKTNKERAAKLLSSFIKDRVRLAEGQAEIIHRHFVKTAILNGETVPEQILADYKNEIDDWTEIRDTRAAARREVGKVDPVGEPKTTELEKAASPVRQGVSAAIASIEEGGDFKQKDSLVKQLKSLVGREVKAAEDAEAVEDTEAVWEGGQGLKMSQSLRDRGLTLAQAQVRLDNTIRTAQELGVSEADIQALQAVSDQMSSKLKADGFEVADYLLGRDYHEKMKVIGDFIKDDTLEVGREVITRIKKPAVNYQGQIIQAAEVEISQGTKEVEGDTEFTRKKERLEARIQEAEKKLELEHEQRKADVESSAETTTDEDVVNTLALLGQERGFITGEQLRENVPDRILDDVESLESLTRELDRLDIRVEEEVTPATAVEPVVAATEPAGAQAEVFVQSFNAARNTEAGKGVGRTAINPQARTKFNKTYGSSLISISDANEAQRTIRSGAGDADWTAYPQGDDRAPTAFLHGLRLDDGSGRIAVVPSYGSFSIGLDSFARLTGLGQVFTLDPAAESAMEFGKDGPVKPKAAFRGAFVVKTPAIFSETSPGKFEVVSHGVIGLQEGTPAATAVADTVPEPGVAATTPATGVQEIAEQYNVMLEENQTVRGRGAEPKREQWNKRYGNPVVLKDLDLEKKFSRSQPLGDAKDRRFGKANNGTLVAVPVGDGSGDQAIVPRLDVLTEAIWRDIGPTGVFQLDPASQAHLDENPPSATHARSFTSFEVRTPAIFSVSPEGKYTFKTQGVLGVRGVTPTAPDVATETKGIAAVTGESEEVSEAATATTEAARKKLVKPYGKVSRKQQQKNQQSKADNTSNRSDTGEPQQDRLFEVSGPAEMDLPEGHRKSALEYIATAYAGHTMFEGRGRGFVRGQLNKMSAANIHQLIHPLKGRQRQLDAGLRHKLKRLIGKPINADDTSLAEALSAKATTPEQHPYSTRLQRWVDGFFKRVQPIVNFAVQSAGSSQAARKRRLGESSKKYLPQDRIGFLKMQLEMETNPTHQREISNNLMDLRRMVGEKTHQVNKMLDEGVKEGNRTKWAHEIQHLDAEISALNDIGPVFTDRPLLAGQDGWDTKLPFWSASLPYDESLKSDSGSPYGFLRVDEKGKLRSVRSQSELFQSLYKEGSKDPNRRNIKPEARAVILLARAEFLQQWQANQSLITDTGALVKTVEATIDKWSRGRLNKNAVELQRRLHKGVPLYARWFGIRNHSALTLALDDASSIPDHGVVTAKMVDSFVKELTDETGSFTSDEAQQLREYLLRVFMSIDSNIDFSDLRIHVRERIQGKEGPRGVYLPELSTIQVKPGLVNTVAHEVGHYLMHKWARELTGDANWETSTRLAVQHENVFYNSEQTPVASEPRVEWFNQFREFITTITAHADTRKTQQQIQLHKNKKKSSLLENQKIEAFARFVDWFTEKTQVDAATGSTLGGTIGERTKARTRFQDNFTEADFVSFVNLIQSKQGLDRTDHNPFGTEYDRIDTPYNGSWLTRLPDAILAQAARMGAVILDNQTPERLKFAETVKVVPPLDEKLFNQKFLEVLGAPYRGSLWDVKEKQFLDKQQQETYSRLYNKMFEVQAGKLNRSRLTDDEASQWDEFQRLINVAEGWTASGMPSHPARVAFAISRHLPLIREKAEQLLPSIQNEIAVSQGVVTPLEYAERPDGSEGLLVSTRVRQGLSLIKDRRERNTATGLWETIDEEQLKSIQTTRLGEIDEIPLNMVERVVGTDVFQSSHPDVKKKGKKGVTYLPSPLLTMKELDDYAEGRFLSHDKTWYVGETFDQAALDHKITERVMEVGKENLRYLLNAYDADLSKMAMQWYEGANKIAAQLARVIRPWASGDDLNRDQAAGILASLSPQAEWNQNIARAFRLVQAYNHFQSNPSEVFSEEMFQWWAKSVLGTEAKNYHKALKEIRGRKISPDVRESIQEMDVSRAEKSAHLEKAKRALERRKVADIKVAKELLRDNVARLESRSKQDNFHAVFTETFTGDRVNVTAEYHGSYVPKSWLEMTGSSGVFEKSRMIRAYEETQYEDDLGMQNPALEGKVLPKKSRQYVVYQPDGTTDGVVALNDTGTTAGMTWGSWSELESALSILMDGSASNISERLGLGHKVRSFFNNINVPSDERSVTIDTHAIAAFYFSPYGSKDIEVTGTMSGVSTAATGWTGMNPMIAEAYFQLAEELGVSPRALQSVTWEAMRGLIPSEQKQSRMRTPKKARAAAVESGEDVPRGIKTTEGEIPPEGTVWDDYQQGKISIEQVRAEIHQRSIDEGLKRAEESDGKASYHNGFLDPDWADESFRLSNDQSRVSEGVSTGQPYRLSPEYRSGTGGSALVGRRVAGDVGRVLSNDELRLGYDRTLPETMEVPESGDRPPAWNARREHHTRFIREAQLFINTFRASAESSEGAAPRYYSELAEDIRRGYINAKRRLANQGKKGDAQFQPPSMILGWISGSVKKGELDFLGFENWLKHDARRYTAAGELKPTRTKPLTRDEKRLSGRERDDLLGRVSVDEVLRLIGYNQLEIVEFINEPWSSRVHQDGGIGPTSSPHPTSVRQWPLAKIPIEEWREGRRDLGEVTDHRIRLFKTPDHTTFSASGGYNHRTLAVVLKSPIVSDEVAEHTLYRPDNVRDTFTWLMKQDHVPHVSEDDALNLYRKGAPMEIRRVLGVLQRAGVHYSKRTKKFYWGGDGTLDLTQSREEVEAAIGVIHSRRRFQGNEERYEIDKLLASPHFDSSADAMKWMDQQVAASTQVVPERNLLAHVRVQDRVYPTYNRKQVEALWQRLRDDIYEQGFFSKTVRELQEARAEYDELHWADQRYLEGDERLSLSLERLSRRRLGLLSELGSKESYDTTRPNALRMPGRYDDNFDPRRPLFQLGTEASGGVSFSLTDAVDRGILTDREVTMLMHDSDLRSNRHPSEHSTVLSEKARSYGLETRQLWVDEIQSDWAQSETAVLEAIAEGYAAKLQYTIEERAHWKRERTRLRKALDFNKKVLASPKGVRDRSIRELVVRDLEVSIKILDESIKAVGSEFIQSPHAAGRQPVLKQWDGPGRYEIPDDAKRQIRRNLKKGRRPAEGLGERFRSLIFDASGVDTGAFGHVSRPDTIPDVHHTRLTVTGWEQPPTGMMRSLKSARPDIDWKMDALKRVIRLGVEGGYDSVGLTDAATQRRRWGMEGRRLISAEWLYMGAQGTRRRPITEPRGRRLTEIRPELDAEATPAEIEDFIPSGLMNIRLEIEGKRGSLTLKDTYLVKVNQFGRVVKQETLSNPSGEDTPAFVGQTFDSMVQVRDPKVSVLQSIKESPETDAVIAGGEANEIVTRRTKVFPKIDAAIVGGTAYESVYGERVGKKLNGLLEPWGARMRPVRLGREVTTAETGGQTVTGSSFQVSDSLRQDLIYKGFPVWEKDVLNEAQLNEKFPNLSREEQLAAADEAGFEVLLSDDAMHGDVEAERRGKEPTKEPIFGTKEDRLLPVSTIIERVAKGLGNLQVSVGRTRGFRGIYKPRLGSIWMKAANDLEVLSHEVGHHLYTHLFKKGKRFVQEAWTSELIALGEARPNLLPEKASTTRRVREGAAEFFRIWSHDPQRAKAVAPEFYAEFEGRISGDLGRTLRDFQKEYIRHFEANPADRFAAHLDFYTGRSLVAGDDRMLRWEVLWLNEQAPTKKFVREMVRLQRGGKKRGVLADVFDVNDLPEFILDDAFRLGELAKGAVIKAKSFLKIGVRGKDFKEQKIRNADGTVRTKAFHGGLDEAMAPVREEWKAKGGRFLKLGMGPAGKKKHYFQAFSIYLAARRTKSLIERGADVKPSPEATALGRGGPTLEEAQAFIDQWETPGFKAAAENIYDFQSSLLDYAVDSGALSLEDVNRVRTVSTDYVPFNRVRAVSELILSGGGRKKSLANTKDILKKFRGSGREIVDPIESIVKNTMEIVQQVESNTALLALTRMIGGFDAKSMESIAQYIEPVPARMEKVVSKKNVKDILKILSSQGIAFKDAPKWEKDGVEVPESVIHDAEILIQSFRPLATVTPYGNEISVIENGTRKYYRVNNKQLYDSLSTVAISPSQVEVIKWLGTGTQMLRRMATTTLEFLIRNPVRDTLQASVASKNIFIPGWTTARGLFSILAATNPGRALNKKLQRNADTWYDEFQNSLGGGYTLGSLDRDVVMEQVYELTPIKRRGFLNRLVRDPLTALRRFQEMMENSSRVGDFALSVKRLEREGFSPEEARAQAAYGAAEVTVNFKRMGVYGRNMNQTKAFFNASIQGKARLAEVFKRNPVGSTLKALSTITPISILSWYMNKDDEEYDELLDWQKKGFWWFPLGKEAGHEWFVIPKPWELAHFFGNIPEAALNYVYKGEDGERLIKEIFPDEDSVYSLIGQLIPTAILPIVEVGFNRSLFRQGPIVSPYQWNVVSPEHQSGRYTSETARQLAKLMDWKRFGAAHIDHLLQGYTAGIGGYGTDTTDALLRKEKITIPNTDVGFDNPIAALVAGELERPPVPQKGTLKTRLWGSRALFRPSVAGGGAQSLRDFYEESDALTSVKADMNIEVGRRDFDAWRDLFDEHRDLLLREGRIRNTQKLMSFYRGQINNLYERFDGATAEERGVKEQEYWNRMVDTARRHFRRSSLYAN